ncbi:MAG TPA: hypothetical protein VHG72_17280, partial [Polyangia bacterium]|nr:hypothetical protein [Polyangia bacterium]
MLVIAGALLHSASVRAHSDDSRSDDSSESLDTLPAGDEQRSALAPPITLPTRQATPPHPVNPWFVRPPFLATAGATSEWTLTLYGFAEADMMRDSTRSFNDGLNNNVLAHIQTQADAYPRFQTSIRNSRLGFKGEAPRFGGIRSSGVLEFDLFGNQPSINAGGGSPGQAPGTGDTTEAAYFNNAALR